MILNVDAIHRTDQFINYMDYISDRYNFSKYEGIYRTSIDNLNVLKEIVKEISSNVFWFGNDNELNEKECNCFINCDNENLNLTVYNYYVE